LQWDTRKFNYTYPELEKWSEATEEVKAMRLREGVLKVYGKGAPVAVIRPEFFADLQAQTAIAKPAAAKPVAARVAATPKPAITSSVTSPEAIPEQRAQAIGKARNTHPHNHFVLFRSLFPIMSLMIIQSLHLSPVRHLSITQNGLLPSLSR
jgi:hypothetical protein